MSLLKDYETLHQRPCSSKSPKGTIDKTSKDIFNNKLPAGISKKKSKVKKEVRKLTKMLLQWNLPKADIF